MKAKNSISFRSFARLPLTGLAVGIGLLACGPPFRLMSCPEGTTHNGKGGDVSDVCIPNDQLAGNAGAGGEGGTGAGQGGGSVGASGSGGMGGECEPTATKCVDGAEYTCGSGLTWGDSVACDIACDQAGSKCVVPVQLVGGAGHACALLSDQTVRCWGLGADGQLGNGRGPNGSGPNQLAPKEVANLAGVTKLVAGARSTCAHFADGSMSCWGDNSSKQLQAFDGNVYTPAAIEWS